MANAPPAPDLRPGDIVLFYAPSAGKRKYHLCLKSWTSGSAARFLFINSQDKFESDYVIDCSRLESSIPASATGISVFSCSCVVPANESQLVAFEAKVVGRITPDIARELETHVGQIESFTDSENKLVLASLALIR